MPSLRLNGGSMAKSILPGIHHEIWMETDQTHTAHALGNPDVHVLATIYLIGFIETCCGVSVQSLLESHQATVGTQVNISHRATAPAGARLRITSELLEVSGKHLTFSAQVYHRERLLMDGFHSRAILDKSFISKDLSG